MLAPQARPSTIALAVQALQQAVGRAVGQACCCQGVVEALGIKSDGVRRSIAGQPGQSPRCWLRRAQATVIEPLRRGPRAVEAEAAAVGAPEQLQTHRSAVPLQAQRLVEMERLQAQRLAFAGQQVERLLEEACRRNHHLRADRMVDQIRRGLGCEGDLVAVIRTGQIKPPQGCSFGR